MFELKHLKTLATLASAGNIKKTAELLFTSQSALSHQLKELEHRLDTALFIRSSTPIVFTEKGMLLLNLANNILPEIEETQKALKGNFQENCTLKIAIACHACFQWLIPLTEQLKSSQAKINIEFVDNVFNDDKQPLADILFVDEIKKESNYIYQEIGQFELVAVVAKQHIKANKAYFIAKDFLNETLLTYPINSQQLDIFKLVLNKAIYQPNNIKQVNNSYIMLQMVAANMGIATMPDWLVKSLTKQSLVQSIRLTKAGIFKTLYARYPKKAKFRAEIEAIIPLAMAEFNNSK